MPRDNHACGSEPGSSPDGEQSGSRLKRLRLTRPVTAARPPPATLPPHRWEATAPDTMGRPKAEFDTTSNFGHIVNLPRDNHACGSEPGSSPDGEQSGSRLKRLRLTRPVTAARPPPATFPLHRWRRSPPDCGSAARRNWHHRQHRYHGLRQGIKPRKWARRITGR